MSDVPCLAYHCFKCCPFFVCYFICQGKFGLYLSILARNVCLFWSFKCLMLILEFFIFWLSIFLLENVIYFHSSDYHLYTNDSHIYISSTDLSFEFQRHIVPYKNSQMGQKWTQAHLATIWSIKFPVSTNGVISYSSQKLGNQSYLYVIPQIPLNHQALLSLPM